MPFYLGTSTEPLQLVVAGVAHKLSVSAMLVTNNYLMSADGFSLQDKNGTYLLPKEDK